MGSVAYLGVEVLVLDAVDLLQQVAEPVHEQLLLQCLQHVRAVWVLFHDADSRVRLPYFCQKKNIFPLVQLYWHCRNAILTTHGRRKKQSRDLKIQRAAELALSN